MEEFIWDELLDEASKDLHHVLEVGGLVRGVVHIVPCRYLRSCMHSECRIAVMTCNQEAHAGCRVQTTA